MAVGYGLFLVLAGVGLPVVGAIGYPIFKVRRWHRIISWAADLADEDGYEMVREKRGQRCYADKHGYAHGVYLLERGINRCHLFSTQGRDCVKRRCSFGTFTDEGYVPGEAGQAVYCDRTGREYRRLPRGLRDRNPEWDIQAWEDRQRTREP